MNIQLFAEPDDGNGQSSQVPEQTQNNGIDLASELAKLKIDFEKQKVINDRLSKENKERKEALNSKMSDEEKANAERETERAELELLRKEINQGKLEKATLEAEKIIAETKGKLNIDPKKFDFDKSVKELLGTNHEFIGNNAKTLNGLLNAVIESIKAEQTENNFANHTSGIKSGGHIKPSTIGERVAKSTITPTQQEDIKKQYK